MRDGLWIVDRGSIYGAFVIREGQVTVCAPILRKNIGWYKTIAQWVPTLGQDEEEEDYPPHWRKNC